MSVENELFYVFTFYSLSGNPLDPEYIRAQQFIKLAKDCHLIGSAVSEAQPPLTEADIQVAYTAEVKCKRPVIAPEKASNVVGKDGIAAVSANAAAASAMAGAKKMNYNDFLTCLMKLSIKVYPRSRTVDDAFQRLLMDNVLPLAARRAPVSVDPYLQNEDVQRLFDYYCDALEQIFQYYASADKRSAKALVQHAISSGSSTGGLGATASSFTLAGKSPARATRAANSMTQAMGYPEFLKFASDFDLSSSVILSTLEIGDIYLSSIKAVDPDSTIRKLTFPEFWEALVRCALVAYSKISDATIIDRIRGLFLYMWRSLNQSVPRAFTERRNVTTYAGDLLSGAMLFNKRFTAAWAVDGYRDYLSPESAPLESGKTVLGRLLRKGGSVETMLLAAGSNAAGYSATAGGMVAGALSSQQAMAAVTGLNNSLRAGGMDASFLGQSQTTPAAAAAPTSSATASSSQRPGSAAGGAGIPESRQAATFASASSASRPFSFEAYGHREGGRQVAASYSLPAGGDQGRSVGY